MRRAFIGLVFVLGCSRSSSDEQVRVESGRVDPSRGGEDGGTEPSAEPFALGDRAAVREAYQEAVGRDLGEEGCVEWSESFPRVVLVGSFAHDRGCMLEGFFVDRQWYDGRRADAVSAGLETRGWGEADSEARQKLARQWVDSVIHVFGGRFVQEAATPFMFDDTPAFEPVKVIATDDLGVLVSGWREEPSGMVWEQGYRFEEYRFDRDGVLTTTSSRGFAVDGERIAAYEAGSAPSAPPQPSEPTTPRAVPPAPPQPGATPRTAAPSKPSTPAAPLPTTKPSTRAPH